MEGLNDEVLARVEARLEEISATRHRLAREDTMLTEAARRLRAGAPASPVLADLWRLGIDLNEAPVQARRR